MRRVRVSLWTALAVIAAMLLLTSPRSGAQTASAVPRPQHVFIIILENKGFDETFGPGSDAPYLAHDLRNQGELLANYYATGHHSLDNYITLLSGQAPNPETQADCFTYTEFSSTAASLDADGQAHGQGCVYPSMVLTVADQLEKKKLTWRGYMEDMGKPCQHPDLNQPDDHIKAKQGDQYATRHNPFVYFHTIVNDQPRCNKDVVPITQLDRDLSNAVTTPNFVFITPNLCNDGHDGPSDICQAGFLKSTDRFLRKWVPKILDSAAYKNDGILIITFDEAETTDGTSCCNEPTGPNVQQPGLADGGPGDRSGGGRIGAVMLSRYVSPGSIDLTTYNHYGLLRGLEDLFGLDHLGYAQKASPTPFDQLPNMH
jgi:hypothetical protein